MTTAHFMYMRHKCPLCGAIGKKFEDYSLCPICNTKFNQYIILELGKEVLLTNN